MYSGVLLMLTVMQYHTGDEIDMRTQKDERSMNRFLYQHIESDAETMNYYGQFMTQKI